MDITSGPRRRNLLRTCLTLLLAIIGGAFCILHLAPGEEAQGGAAAAPSNPTQNTLRVIASARPCAALVLLHLIEDVRSLGDGSLYLESCPTQRGVMEVLDSLPSDRAAALAHVLQVNPYGGLQHLIRVRWWKRTLAGDAILTLHVEGLGSDDGSRMLEPVTIVRFSGNTLEIPSAQASGQVRT